MVIKKWPNVIQAQVEFWKNKKMVGFGWVKRKEIAHPESNYREGNQKIITTSMEFYKLNKRSRRVDVVYNVAPKLLDILPRLDLEVVDARGLAGNRPKYVTSKGHAIINGEEYEIIVFQNNSDGRLQVNAYNKKKGELIRVCINNTNLA